MIDEIVLAEPQVTTVTTDIRKVRILNYEITGSSVTIALCKVDVNGKIAPLSFKNYELSEDEFTDFMNNTIKQTHIGMERGNYLKQAVRLYVKNKLNV